MRLRLSQPKAGLGLGLSLAIWLNIRPWAINEKFIGSFSIFAQELRSYNSVPEPKFTKAKGTLFSESSKVEECRVPLDFSPLTKIDKTKGTLFSITFKVEESKLSLDFQFLLMGWNIANSSFYVDHVNKMQYLILENAYISAP